MQIAIVNKRNGLLPKEEAYKLMLARVRDYRLLRRKYINFLELVGKSLDEKKRPFRKVDMLSLKGKGCGT
jgi:hypothetical protein